MSFIVPTVSEVKLITTDVMLICGHKMEEMPLSVRKWDCPSCGATDIDRDLNAALNIRDKGTIELKAAGQSFLLMEAA